MMTNHDEERNMFEEEAAQPVFDREEWLAQKNAEREKAYEMISQMTKAVAHDGERYQSCLNLMSRFGRYSVGNILLLEAQKPDAKRLADYKSWKEKNVSIKKGETGIIILEPGKPFTNPEGRKITPINTKKVFDVSQTSLSSAVEPHVKMDEKLLLRALIHNAPCQFRFAEPENMPRGTVARFSAADNTVYVVRGEDPAVSFMWIARELASAHFRRIGYEAGRIDFVSASAAYVLCQRNGVETAAFDFTKLPDYFAELTEIQMKGTLGKIREVSNTITADMQQFFEQQKEDRSRDDAR